MNLHFGLGQRPTWAEVAVPYGTPRDLCAVVAKHVRYQAEAKDHWSPAEETWARGRGDCEDLSVLVRALCQISQFDVTLHAYLPNGLKGAGHVVPVGQWNGQWWFANNGAYREVDAEEDLLQVVAQSLGWPPGETRCLKLADATVANLIQQGAAGPGPGLPG